jgi:putative spermidine/putrescine transport system substrate-binding protein
VFRKARSLVPAVVLGLVVACGSGAAPASAPGATSPGATSAAAASAGVGYDVAKAKDQAKTFVTYGIPNDWANYGQQFTQFCMAKFGFDCNRPERSQGDSLKSGELLQKWDAEKNNPVSVLADATMLFVGPAEKIGALSHWLPQNASLLPDGYKGRNGGWIATYSGVPSIVANVDFLKSKGLPVPASFADLLNPGYAKMIGLSKVGTSGVSTSEFVAMNLAAGGTLEDYTKGIAFARKLLPNLTSQANIDTFEKGEVPISLQLDLTATALVTNEKARGVNAQVAIPSDGSIWLPSALLMNGYETAHTDFAKMFTEWVLTDEGQLLFARFGARPIRSVVGTNLMTVPESAKSLWLPESLYQNVKTVDISQIDVVKLGEIWENEVLAGG